MDPFHERLARIGLAATEEFGFALAGGHAVVAHGFVDRWSNDVDLFAALDANLAAACVAATAGWTAEGLVVSVEQESRYYVRFTVADPGDGRASKVELVADVRLNPPVRLGIGPVLHPDDVAGGKVEALYGRAECRDFIDVTAMVESGRYSRDRLIDLARRRDTGFDIEVFADMLAGVHRFDDAEFARYGVTPEAAATVRGAADDWRRALIGG